MGYFDFYTDTLTDQQIDDLNSLAAIHESAGMRPWDAAIQAVKDKLQEALEYQAEIRGLILEAATKKEIDAGAHQAATSPKNNKPEPTPAQQAAGNYAKGSVYLYGLEIAIENPEGSTRNGVSPDGKEWQTVMRSHYGYLKGTTAKDKDHIDCFIGKYPDSDSVFVVDQVNPDGKFDEHKVMMAFRTLKDARKGYLKNYEEGWQGLGAITEMSVDEFKEWLKDGDTLKPVDGAILEAAAAVNGFMKSPTGNLDFGYITQEIAVAIKREAAPIRLRMGNATEGLLHIELRHSKDIAALGYKNAVEFVYAITRHFDAIYPPSKQGRGLTLVVTSGKLKFATIQLESENGGAFYDIKNATPGRNDQFKNKDPLWINNAGPSVAVGFNQPPLISQGLKAGLDDLTLPLTPDAVKPVLEGAGDEKESWQMTKMEWNSFYVKQWNQTYSRKMNIHDSEYADWLHMDNVDQAIKQGKPVPDDVLKDYPDLTKPAYDYRTAIEQATTFEDIQAVFARVFPGKVRYGKRGTTVFHDDEFNSKLNRLTGLEGKKIEQMTREEFLDAAWGSDSIDVGTLPRRYYEENNLLDPDTGKYNPKFAMPEDEANFARFDNLTERKLNLRDRLLNDIADILMNTGSYTEGQAKLQADIMINRPELFYDQYMKYLNAKLR